jgi:uncharacterized damage-inducible protein DinB
MSADLSAISLGELLAYDEHETNRWREWFSKQPPELLNTKTGIMAMPEGDDLRWLLFHIFAVQLRYAQWILNLPLMTREEMIALPRTTLDELFAIGDQARKLLAEFAAKTTIEELAEVVEYSSPKFKMKASKRKCFLQAILHGDRHWAQIAVLVREDGYKTDWTHDFIMSPTME